MQSNVVLVTGGLSGIGRATALAFAETGANLIVTGRREKASVGLIAELEAAGAPIAMFVRADAQSEDDTRSAIKQIESRFGRLDVAVNNAGIEGTFSPVEKISVETYRSVFDTNVLGVILGMKYELELMKRQGFGTIVNLSSIGGQIGFPTSAVYAASKHAVEGLTKSAALEVAAEGIRINAVAPGPTESPMFDRLADYGMTRDVLAGMIPAKRAGTPAEVAQAILFLSSQRASFITGHTLAVDGGYLAQ
ncbi:2,5-dichloro-2,5-cyclohexadiene-1,4-diol dehydrogenase, putative [Ricinus communis]|jgi:NAD(P)-dependent dehydrogenase (short-subunit alcohol dehydrogenase family)|uniref:2,5-dichloro-2,5-cyclohexadiene-1,4-diol dehydrogenase, putative n=1 Tax=Ricinus communis TaxID=3988 RepID=B9T8A8_RICCO|nr:2,5-dichloro-2,5-cyclohexadiene-1,4-diol dehydrogenase, putative [Ricinus communis]